MALVNTLAGPVDSAQLGPVLSHEHVVSGMGGMERVPGLFDPAAAERRALEALARAHEAGYRTLIDCTPLDLGRQVAIFERLAGRTPMQIVACTGVYRWVPLSFHSWDPDTFAEYLLRDLQEGMDGTEIRAGIIKLAWDVEARLTEGGAFSVRAQLEKCARGAARAAKAAGVPITCHTLAADRYGEPLLDLFAEEGLDLRAVTIGHTNDSRDIDYVLGLARRGATVGLDRFARVDDAEVERRSAIALALIRAGFAEQTCLGHDAAAYSINRGPATGGPRPEDPECWLKIPTLQVPWLRVHGASEDEIDALMRRSVRATFEAAAAMRG
ncbi:MAG: phosphotriesterase [Chloroflexi bacterium]|nr:phosphotriesterase [Chloroflexota bacterium]